jgi:MFS family permease
LNSAVMTGSRVVGPAIAGVLITTVGAEWAFAANAITYLAVLAALLAMDRSALRSPPRVIKAKGQLREGFRYVWATTELRLSIILLAVIGTLAFEYQVTLPLLAERTFHGGANTFTMLFSAMSAGSVLGALTVARRTHVDAAFLARASIGLGITTTALTLAPTFWLALIAVVPVGFFAVFLLSGSNAVIQLQADPSMRGRVLALTAVVFLGSTPIGGPIAGAVAEHVGPRAGIGIGAVASGLAGAWTLNQLNRARTQRSAGFADRLLVDDRPLVLSKPPAEPATGRE